VVQLLNITWDFSFKYNIHIIFGTQAKLVLDFENELKCYTHNRVGGFVHSGVQTVKIKIIITAITKWQLSARICFRKQINLFHANANVAS